MISRYDQHAGFVNKPYNPTELQNAIRVVMG